MKTSKLARPLCALLSLMVLFARGAFADERDDYITLVESARMGDVVAVKRVLDAGSKVDRPDGDKWTPLMHAADAGQLETARTLLESGAQVNAIADYGVTALENAVASGNNALVQLLLQHGAIANPPRDSSSSQAPRLPQKMAIIRDNAEGLDLLKKAGAQIDPFPKEARDRSALTLAAEFRARKCLTYLLEHGCDPNQRDAGGNLPLAVSCGQDDLEMVKRLVEHGADVNGVSQGTPVFSKWPRMPLTPLAAATVGNRADTVKFLLSCGADPRAQDDMAIKFADLVGNQSIYNMLLASGVPKPKPYSFAALRDAYDPSWQSDLPTHTKAAAKPWSIDEIISSHIGKSDNEPAPAITVPLKVAIITEESERSNEAAALLTGELSKIPNVSVLERDEVNKLAAEQMLADFSAKNMSGCLRLGKLLGADGLIFLGDQKSAKGEIAEARLVSTKTGLIVKTVYNLKKDSPETWSHQIATTFQSTAERLSMSAKAANLISLTDIQAAVSTTEGQEIGKQICLGLRSLLAQQPNVFLLERRELNRLSAEKGLNADTAAFLNSAWIVDGSIELSGETANRQLTLRLRMQRGAGKAPIMLTLTGKADEPSVFLQKVASSIMEAITDKQGVAEFSTEEEAKAYFAEAQWYFKSEMWEEAQIAADTAWSLGLRTDDALELRLRSMAKRIQMAAFTQYAEKAEDLSGISQFMAYRAPMIFPKTNEAEITPETAIELANQMLDAYESVIDKMRQDYPKYRSRFFPVVEMTKCASKPLRSLNCLSAREEYYVSLAALRRRLLSVYEELRKLGLAQKDATLLHLASFAYFVNGAYWEDDEDRFHEQVDKIVNDALSAQSLMETHAILSEVIGAAREYANKVTGNANCAWRRHAGFWAQSEDLRIATLAECLLGADEGTLSARYHSSVARLYATYATLEEMNPEPAGLSLTDPDLNGFTGPSEKGAWMDHARLMIIDLSQREYKKGLIRASWRLPTEFNTQGLGYSDHRLLPEWQVFFVANCKREMQRIASFGSSVISSDISHCVTQMTVAELSSMSAHASEAYAKCVSLNEQSSKRIEWFKDIFTRQLARFPLELKSRVSLSLQDYRIPLQQIDPSAPSIASLPSSVFSLNGRLWVANCGQGMFELDERGQLLSEVLYPMDSDLVIAGRESGRLRHSACDMSPEYFAAAAFCLEGKSRPNAMLVYSFKSKEWKRLPYCSQDPWDNSLKIIGDKIVYSFEFHPDSTTGIQASKDTTRGIMMVDIATGKETLLASTHRKPAQGPLDQPSDSTYKIWKVSDHSVLIRGQIYDIQLGKWSPAGRGQEDQLEFAAFREIEPASAGRVWSEANLTDFARSLVLRSYRTPKEKPYRGEGKNIRPIRLTIPFQPAVPVKLDGRIAPPDSNQPARRCPEIILHSAGMVFWDNVDCYFIPATKVRAIIEDAMKDAK